MSVKLEEIIPKRSEFKLLKTKRSYALRPLSLDDELWLQHTYGDQLEKILGEIRMKEICQIVFHQMEEESKAYFAAKDITFMDDNGESKTHRVGGAALLLCMISGGMTEKLEIFNALMETVGISRPIQDRLVASDQLKKKQSRQQTGRK